MYFCGLNLGTLVQGHLGPRDLCLNKFGKEHLGMQCYIRNFKHFKKIIETSNSPKNLSKLDLLSDIFTLKVCKCYNDTNEVFTITE